MLIRYLLLLLLGWVLWKLYRNYMVKKTRSRSGETKPLPRGKMVKCEYCELHLPQPQALPHEGLWFCSAAHKDRFLTNTRH